MTVADLADELQVSLRTLSRDIALLREAGAPIDSDRGRGGGLRLQHSWSLGRLHLTSEEAVDLLLSLAIAEKLDSPLLLTRLTSLRRKIVASFGEIYQARLKSLRRRILIGGPATPAIQAGYSLPGRSPTAAVARAFFDLRCLELIYTDRCGVETNREVEPQFLYLSSPVWYLLAFDLLRHDVRFFRIDRIGEARVLARSFKPANPAPYLAAAEAGITSI